MQPKELHPNLMYLLNRQIVKNLYISAENLEPNFIPQTSLLNNSHAFTAYYSFISDYQETLKVKSITEDLLSHYYQNSKLLQEEIGKKSADLGNKAIKLSKKIQNASKIVLNLKNLGSIANFLAVPHSKTQINTKHKNLYKGNVVSFITNMNTLFLKSIPPLHHQAYEIKSKYQQLLKSSKDYKSNLDSDINPSISKIISNYNLKLQKLSFSLRLIKLGLEQTKDSSLKILYQKAQSKLLPFKEYLNDIEKSHQVFLNVTNAKQHQIIVQLQNNLKLINKEMRNFKNISNQLKKQSMVFLDKTKTAHPNLHMPLCFYKRLEQNKQNKETKNSEIEKFK